MIYLFHGSDSAKVRAKAFQWVAAARAKQPDASYIRIPADELTPAALESAVATQGLFFSKTLVLLDDPFSLKEAADLVLDRLDDLAASPNPVAIVAPKLLAARAKKVAAVAAKTFVADVKEKKERGFNGALVNALAARNRAALWLEVTKALRLGDAPEQIHGLLHWKARDLMQKGKPGGRELSFALIALLRESRGGELPLDEALERFALSV